MNNNGFLKILEKLNLKTSDDIREGKLESIEVNDLTKKAVFKYSFPKVPNVHFLEEFISKSEIGLKEIFNLNEIESIVLYPNNEIGETTLEEYYKHILENLTSKKPLYKVLENFNTNFSDNKVVFYVASKEDEATLGNAFKEIEAIFKSYFLDFVSVEAVISHFEKPMEDDIKYNITKIYTEYENQPKTQPTGIVKKTNKDYRSKTRKKTLEVNIAPSKIKDLPVDEMDLVGFRQLNFGESKVAVEGEIIKSEIINRGIHNFFEAVIQDDTGVIMLKSYVKDENRKLFEEDLVKGKIVKVIGYLDYDKFSRCITLKFVNYVPLGVVTKDHLKDNSDVKRVELHAHTKMSAQDGVLDIKDYVKRASLFGHQAIAVTDTNSLQALPDLDSYCEEYNIKPIYGLESYLIRESDYLITPGKLKTDRNLKDARFVVYDLESTGLSSNYNEIIEISAVRVYKGEIVGEFNSFVKPKAKISNFITKLTSITNDDVRTAPSIEQVLPEFIDFIGDDILVAHNSSFDNTMLYANMNRIGIDNITFPTIDTLKLAHNFYNHRLARFNLKALAKEFNVDLIQHHRAINDARATAQIFLKMLNDLDQMGIKTYNSLNDSIIEDAYKYVFPYHLTLLATNRKGIKHLNEIVSLSLTEHFYKEPRLLEKVLDEKREGLLVGSGCQNGEIFTIAYNGSIEELEERMEYYDYIEIQPPYQYAYLFSKNYDKQDIDNEGSSQDIKEALELISTEYEEQIKDTIKKIITVARKMGKIVVATGDVHQLDEEDTILRQIFVEAPQVGGGIHELAKAGIVLPQHYMTTEEMLSHFLFLGEAIAYEIVVTNTNLINDKIEQLSLFPKKLFAPKDDFLVDQGIQSVEEELKRITYQKAESLYGNPLPKYVNERLKKELKNIIDNDYATIYYISYMLTNKCKEDNSVVGSRGSVGSSFVAYCMNITDVNCLVPHYYCPDCHYNAFKYSIAEQGKYEDKIPDYLLENLSLVTNGLDLKPAKCPKCGKDLVGDGCDIPFETFLGFKGDKVPDIDLNFSSEYQTTAHDYTRELFGENNVFRAGTVSTVQGRTAYGYVKNFLDRHDKKMSKTEMDIIIEKITGVKRTTGQHPGGIVVIPKNIDFSDVVAIQYPSDNVDSDWKTIHYEYDKYEKNLLKLDLLGHRDPTMISKLMEYVERYPEEFPFKEYEDIPLNDPKVLSIFNSVSALGVTAEEVLEQIGTTGIPEFNTPLGKEMLSDIKPKTVSELIKISGFGHGTNVWSGNQRELYLGNTLNNKVDFDLLIGCRDDIMLYLVNKGVDSLTAFKIMESVRKGRSLTTKQEQVLQEHNVPEWYIDSCKKIAYMFPKAHAAAYVMMALRIAWFKVYKPLYYYAVYFEVRGEAFDIEAMPLGYEAIREALKVANLEKEENQKRRKIDVKLDALIDTLSLALEATARGFKFKQVDLDKSEASALTIEGNSLYLPFSALPSVGATTALSITEARSERRFSSVSDLRQRTKISKTIIDHMRKLGILDHLPKDDQINLF